MNMPVVSYAKIRPLRQAKGLRQSQVATELGISRPTYALVERGERELTLSQLYILARLLSVEPGALCTNLEQFTPYTARYDVFKETVVMCMLYGAENGAISKDKLAGLVYLAEFAWYYFHKQPMSGVAYRSTAKGPVADDYYRTIDELYDAQVISIEPRGAGITLHILEQQPARLLGKDELYLIYNVCSKWRLQSTQSLVRFILGQTPSQTVHPPDIVPYETILGEPRKTLY